MVGCWLALVWSIYSSEIYWKSCYRFVPIWNADYSLAANFCRRRTFLLLWFFSRLKCKCVRVLLCFRYIVYGGYMGFPRFVRLFISSSLTFELFIIIDGSMAEWRIEPNIYLQSINKHKYILLRFFLYRISDGIFGWFVQLVGSRR